MSRLTLCPEGTNEGSRGWRSAQPTATRGTPRHGDVVPKGQATRRTLRVGRTTTDHGFRPLRGFRPWLPSQVPPGRLLLLVAALLTSPAHAQFATKVISYDPGADPDPGYTDPTTALGEPTRVTGKLAGFPGPVTPFNPAFDTDELVSIGLGGHLTLAFDHPVLNDPANPYGVDLLVFGNTGFIDVDFPNGVVGGLFGADGGSIELSADGRDWVTIDPLADGAFPTLGFLDLEGPFDPDPGRLLTDFTRPVDPGFDYMGATWADILAAYGTSGGGVPIDIGAYALDEITYIRFTNLTDDALSPDIDGVADVAPIPAPTTLTLLAMFAITRRRRHASQ
jgi:hypothetical protein